MTSTPINTFQDILDAIQQNPDLRTNLRQYLLTDELIQLPERFAAFVELTTENFTLVHQRLGTLESDVAELKESHQRLEAKVDDNFNFLNNKIDDNFNFLNNKIDDNFTVLNEKIDGNFNTLNGRMDRGFGQNYEYRVEKLIPAFAGQQLGLRAVQVIKGPAAGVRTALQAILDGAQDSGTITPSQAADVYRLDLIFSARTAGDTETFHAAAEVSITISAEDIDRAAQRAPMLAQATGGRAVPIVIGTTISDQDTDYAAQHNVQVILAPESD